MSVIPRFRLSHFVAALCLSGVMGLGSQASAQVTAFKQAVAEGVSRNAKIAAFYRAQDFAPIWTGADDAARLRRIALIEGFRGAAAHGLPEAKYDPETIIARLGAAGTARARGQLEVALTELFLDFAGDIQTGILTPANVDEGIKRIAPLRDAGAYLQGITGDDPRGFVQSLSPETPEYLRLIKAKMDLQRDLAAGGWGQAVPAKALKPGETGRSVIVLRNRLIAMGYLPRSVSATYDSAMQKAVQTFQENHGLTSDGVAGPTTIQAINVPLERRLKSVIGAMERERWLNLPRGDRHVLVNITDFHARIIDFGIVTFQTRSVVGHKDLDRRTPEFSDVMEHLVVNPTWNVPRSIATKEYLPAFKRNANSNRHLKLINSRGQVVDRSQIDFSAYNERNFPFDLKQPPSNRNALGLVKFIFPNRYNIYLHDTPAKSLFKRETRAFSHGCIRLADPFDFAYALLAKQEAEPKSFFQSILRTGRETIVPLDTQVPVHLIYRTAVTQAKGRINFRPDVYGRDAKVWSALERAGVSLDAVQG